ncbi:MAG: RNA polymerase sigma factor [Bacteroidales bacterium]|nr:RNA polymerase sigma factor [Bacteroidales bacterium]
MYGICLRYTKDRDEAQDILQEGFIKVFTNLGKFDNRGSFEGWIRRIMINVALERFRKTNYMYPVEDITVYKDKLDYDDLESNLSQEELLKMIQELSPKYRMVFNLYAVEGYSHQEISQMLNISEGTSKSNLSRARIILQERLKEYSKTTVKFG